MRSAATKLDETMVALLGGHRFEGTVFTSDQCRALSTYYGFDPDHPRKCGEEALKQAKAHYEQELAAWEAKKDPGSRRPKPPNERAILDGNQKLISSGDFRDVMRMTSHDGRRVMAFLSRYLDPGEDPVALVATALSDSGFDVDLGALERENEHGI